MINRNKEKIMLNNCVSLCCYRLIVLNGDYEIYFIFKLYLWIEPASKARQLATVIRPVG